jgi:uncharacterized membrane protein
MVHTGFSVLALAIGGLVLVRKKGTRSHRWLGRAYAISMLGLLVTAFLIYNLFGRFGAFHWAAVISSATLVAGLTPAISRRPRPGWVDLHFYFMSYSYLGLLAAAASEIAVRLPVARIVARLFGTSFGFAFGLAVGIPTTLIFLAGSVLVHRKAGTTLRRTRASHEVADEEAAGQPLRAYSNRRPQPDLR